MTRVSRLTAHYFAQCNGQHAVDGRPHTWRGDMFVCGRVEYSGGACVYYSESDEEILSPSSHDDSLSASQEGTVLLLQHFYARKQLLL